MAKFFIGGGLPPVTGVPDVYAYARELRDRGVPILASEAAFLRQVTWCMLQVEHDQEEGELHQALARLAALALAIIEDDDFSIPEGYRISTREGIEGLAIQHQREQEQVDLQIAAAMGIHGIEVSGAEALDALEQGLTPSPELTRVINAARIHLRQGAGLLDQQEDPALAAAHRERLTHACERVGRLLARLLAVPADRDPKVVRENVIRRELRRIEVDALGVQRLTEAEQARRTRELLAWAEEDMGERLTDASKAALAQRLQTLAQSEQEEDADSSGWLFDME